MDDWQPIEMAPRDGTHILLRFASDDISVAYWDVFYAEGGRGYENGFAWIEPCSGEPLDRHYGTLSLRWMPLPSPPLTTDA